MTNYDDIIYLPNHRSKKHPHMPIADRAAQFSPFAALTGHDAAIKETARLTDRKIELDEYEIAILDEKLQKIREQLKEQPCVTVTYFQADEKKAGGQYLTVTECVRKLDEYEGYLVMKDATRIRIEDIIDLVLNC